MLSQLTEREWGFRLSSREKCHISALSKAVDGPEGDVSDQVVSKGRRWELVGLRVLLLVKRNALRTGTEDVLAELEPPNVGFVQLGQTRQLQPCHMDDARQHWSPRTTNEPRFQSVDELLSVGRYFERMSQVA